MRKRRIRQLFRTRYTPKTLQSPVKARLARLAHEALVATSNNDIVDPTVQDITLQYVQPAHEDPIRCSQDSATRMASCEPRIWSSMAS